ncbi:Transcription initiation factor TFIID subunit 5 [Coemansia sp. BCRC 34301]|nr:Transcription initiation factor TFIID subunit 5 [Coemansia sp. BCRC 34301]
MSNRKAEWGGSGEEGAAAADSANGSSGKQVEKVVLQYLKSKGYREAEKALRADAKLSGQESTLSSLAQAFPGSEAGADASVPSWILFYNSAEEGNPDAYNQSYGALRRWIDSSLDAYKAELYAASYPMFVHAYLDLLVRGLSEKAAEFMGRYGGDHAVLHGRDVSVLTTLTTRAHAEDNALARMYRSNKYAVRMTRVGLELLLAFLQENHCSLLLRAVNQHVNIRTVEGSAIAGEAEADVGITGHTQNQLDHFNSQDIALGPPPLDAFVRAETERTLQAEAGRLHKDAAAQEAEALVGTLSQVENERRNHVTDALPMPPPHSAEVAQQIADLKALRKRVALGPAALPSVCMYTLHNTANALTCTAVSPDLSLLAGGFSESYVKIWSLKNEPLRSEALHGFTSSIDDAPCRKLVGHSGAVFGLDVSFDAKYLVSCAEDATARLWSLDTYTNVVCYKGHNHPVWDVAFAPQGFYFATASHDRTARLWSCDHIYALRIFAGHLADVNCVRFHPNAKYVVTGSADKSVRLWDVQRGSCVRVFTGHTASVDTVAVSPDGRIMASAGEDQTVNVWDLGSGRRMLELTGHTGPVYSLAFSQEGTLLLSGSADETVRAWDVKRSNDASDHPIIVQRQAATAATDAMDVDTAEPSAEAAATADPKKRDAAGIWKSNRTPESDALLKTWRTKSTPVYSIMTTKRNLAVAIGAFVL